MTRLTTHLALGSDADAAAALRRQVFVDEMGACERAEADGFDAGAEHLVLRDAARPGVAVGTLRMACGAGYTGREFDLGPLEDDGRALAEIGRICLHPDYRGGLAAGLLLGAAVDRLRSRGAGMVVGTGSFPGADPARHMPAMRALLDAGRAPAALRPKARGPHGVTIEGTGRRADMRFVPALLKAYLRAGAWVGEEAWIDRDMDTVDVCLMLDLTRLRLPAQRSMAEGAR